MMTKTMGYAWCPKCGEVTAGTGSKCGHRHAVAGRRRRATWSGYVGNYPTSLTKDHFQALDQRR